MSTKPKLFILITVLGILALACSVVPGLAPGQPTSPPEDTPTTVEDTPTPAPTPTDLPPIPVQPGEENPDEPVFITGEVSYSSPFFLNTVSEAFVMLEDQAGFVARDREFHFSLASQVMGPIELLDDDTLEYQLALPAIPQGTQLDLDNNGQEDEGVQVFAIAYWSNTWGGPFLETRDGKAWSNAYASTVTDPENDDEIMGGTLVVWAPDENQQFPTGFGDDGLLFTEDDPVEPIPAGYSIVDLNDEPFLVYKDSRPFISLYEGESAVNDYSDLDYHDAFEQLFEKASREYPFTEEKGIDWDALHDEFSQRVDDAQDAADFYRALRDFTLSIPDAHVGLSFNAQVFFEDSGGSFGLVLAELSDGSVIVAQVIPGTPGDDAGIQPGAEILEWDGDPVSEAIDAVEPAFGPYSTEHHKRLEQVIFLTRVPVDTRVEIGYRNPDSSRDQQVTLTAVVDYDSLFAALPSFQRDELAIPVEGEILDESGLGYIRVNTFSGDYNLMAQLWDHYIQGLLDNEAPGLIIDVRTNSGGSGGLSLDFAGYFFEQEVTLFDRLYFSDKTGQFEANGNPSSITPAPTYYPGEVAVLISPYCVSACEGFTYAMSQEGRATIVGNLPTAGAFGEVGRGQYELPEDISLQFPTGRPEAPDGSLVIEGVGVEPDIVVPITEASALGETDLVLQAAIDELLARIGE